MADTLYSGKMLMTGRTVTFTTELAMMLGHERRAMLLQQVHYWLHLIQSGEAEGGKFEDGRWWTYQKMYVWLQRFGFMSRSTIKRIRKHLEGTGLLLRKDEVDLTVEGGVRIWYSIDYELLRKLEDAWIEPVFDEEERVVQNDPTPSEGGGFKVDHWSVQSGPHKERTKEKEELEKIPDLPQAAASGSPAAQLVAGSQFSNIPGRKRSEEKRVKSEEDRKAKIPHDDLTPLGRFVLEQCGRGTNFSVAPALTRAQVDALAAEYEVPYKGTTRLITPDDLFLSDPYYTDWIKTEVYALLRAQGGDKPIARGKMVDAITMGGTVISLKQFLEWREQFIEKQQMDYALAHAETTPEKDYFNFDSLDDDLDDLDEGDETDGS